MGAPFLARSLREKWGFLAGPIHTDAETHVEERPFKGRVTDAKGKGLEPLW